MVILTTVVIIAGAVGWLLQTSRAPERVYVPIPLTSYPGSEQSPSFSPDGNQVLNWVSGRYSHARCRPFASRHQNFGSARFSAGQVHVTTRLMNSRFRFHRYRARRPTLSIDTGVKML
jgi:hypothetical protein